MEAKIDNGTWTPIAAFLSAMGSNNVGLYQDLNGNGTGGETGEPMLNDTLKDYTFNVSGKGTYLYLRAGGRMDSGDEEVAFDNLRVYGTAGTTVAMNSKGATEDEDTKTVWVKVAANGLTSGTLTCDAVLGKSTSATSGTDFDLLKRN